MSIGELWHRGQEGWPRSYPVAYLPNGPLLVAFAGRALGRAGEGRAGDAGRALSTIGFAVWAWEEATDGGNLLRRALGTGALAAMVVGLSGDASRRSQGRR
jgi:hypothetical protein